MNEEILKLIKDYKPSQATVDLLRSKKLIIVAGITSAGKNAIMNGLIATGEYYDVVTSTSREKRENNGVMEVEGVDYFFLTTEEAVANIKAGNYIEVANVHDKINGMLVKGLGQETDPNKHPIADIDVQGVDNVKNMSDKIIAIFVLPPSYEEWIRRMRSRYPDEKSMAEAWPARRRSAIMELEMALSKPYYHFIINDNLDDAIKSAASIARGEDKFNQIDESYHIWAEKILEEIKRSPAELV